MTTQKRNVGLENLDEFSALEFEKLALYEICLFVQTLIERSELLYIVSVTDLKIAVVNVDGFNLEF